MFTERLQAARADDPQLTLTMTPTDESLGVTRPAASESAYLRGHPRGLGDVLARASDVVELFRATQREIARALGGEAFFLALFDEASQMVEVVRQFDSGWSSRAGSFLLGAA